jgi:hypothetical protein
LVTRLVSIEERRDMPRVRVLSNLYCEFRNGRFDEALITVRNDGSVLAGPVSVSVTNAEGNDVSFMSSDPRFVGPAEPVPFVVRFLAQTDEPFGFDDERRGGSDLPEGVEKTRWQPVKLRPGYFVRAWDSSTDLTAWYPTTPPVEPLKRPTII